MKLISFIIILITYSCSIGAEAYHRRIVTPDEAVRYAALTEHVPLRLLKAICMVESHFNQDALHHNDGGSNSYGLCQLKLRTAKAMGFDRKPDSLQNPLINAVYSARYLRYQLERYRNVRKAVRAYNLGHFDYFGSAYELKVMKIAARLK